MLWYDVLDLTARILFNVTASVLFVVIALNQLKKS